MRCRTSIVVAVPFGNVIDHLIDRRWAEPLARIAVFFHAARRADICVEHMQMGRLIFIVADRGVIHVCQLIKRELAVKAKIRVALSDAIAAAISAMSAVWPTVIPAPELQLDARSLTLIR